MGVRNRQLSRMRQPKHSYSMADKRPDKCVLSRHRKWHSSQVAAATNVPGQRLPDARANPAVAGGQARRRPPRHSPRAARPQRKQGATGGQNDAVNPVKPCDCDSFFYRFIIIERFCQHARRPIYSRLSSPGRIFLNTLDNAYLATYTPLRVNFSHIICKLCVIYL